MNNLTKSFLAASILFFSVNAYSQTGWNSINTGSTSYLTSLYFIDANTGFIGGMNGYLAKTTNGGNNWNVLTSGLSGFVRSMDFPNANTGYICGDNSALSRTTNGGVNWSPLTTGASGTFYAVQAPNDLNVYFSSADGKVYKSTNGGVAWNFVQVHSGSILSMNFISIDTGFAAGLTGAVYKTVNGGAGWTPINTYTQNNIWDMSIVNGKVGWFDAYYGTIRKTLDGGTSIIPSFGYNYNFEGISAINEMIAYTCGLNGVLMKTIDGGATWQMQTSGTTEGLNEIFMLNANTGYVVGSGGKLLKTTDGGNGITQFLNILSPNGGEVYKSYDTVNINWTAYGPNNVSVQYTTDNGSSWNNISASVPANNFAVKWVAPNIGSTNIKIKITDLSSALNDISNNPFKITNNAVAVYKVPDILYLKFNNGSVTTPNYALPGNGTNQVYISGHTLGMGGMFDSTLIGGGNTGSTHRATDSSVLYLPATGWTIGFWVSNISLGTTVTNPVYLFGDLNSNFRIYYGGSGGIGTTDTAIMLRMTGGTDVRVPVVKGQSYYIHFIWDAAAQSIKAYRNAALIVTVPQSGFTGMGNGPITIGAHATLASSLSSGMKLDEFRIYGRTIPIYEIYGTYFNTLPLEIYEGIQNMGGETPEFYKLYQNYPNPFNPLTKIRFQIPPSRGVRGVTEVSLKIYDILGKEVASLTPPPGGGKEGLTPGNYEVEWDASNFSSGVYFYKLESGSFTDTKKMVLIK